MMNTPYGSQPSYPPRQPQASPGPPQPQWQAAPAPPTGPPQPQWQAASVPTSGTGWNDPRLHSAPLAAHPAPMYNPNVYGPIAGTAYSPTSPPQPSPPGIVSWGVRYNQNQQYAQRQESKPPLPPRPPSVGGYGPTTGPQTQPSGPWSQAQGTSSYAQAPQCQYDDLSNQQLPPAPPKPPPRPPEYLSLPNDAQGWPHLQYAHNQPSHRYEPNNQQLYQSGGPGDQHRYQEGSASDVHSTVSPIEEPTTYWHPPPPQTIPTDPRTQSDSEFRKHTPKPTFGGPSDWEHFQPISDHAEDPTRLETPTTPTQFHKQDAWHLSHTAEPPSDATGEHVSRISQQPRPGEFLPEQKSPVSSVAAASPVSLPTAPAHLSVSGVHRDHADRSGSPSHSKESPSVGMVVPQRTGTIDSVIQAWNKPLEGQSSWHADKPISSRASSRQSSVSAFSTTRPQVDSAEVTKPSLRPRYDSTPPLPFNSANLDPYSDLEPEYRASLARFVTMLRKESEVSSDISRFNIFKAFVDKELRLRSVLYGIDGGGMEITQAGNGNTIQLSSSAKLDESQVEEPLRLTATSNPSEPIPQTEDTVSRITTPKNKVKAGSPKLAVSSPSNSNDKSFVVIDQASDDIEYSPGGRPKVPKLKAIGKEPQPPSFKVSAAASVPGTSSSKVVASPSDNAPIVLEDYSTGGSESPGRNAPIVLDIQDHATTPGSATFTSKPSSAAPMKFEPSRPVYTPFRYTEASRADLDKLTSQQPAHQAYAAMRQSADSGRILAQASTTVASPTTKGQDKFLGLIRSQSRAHPNNRPATPSNLLVKDPRAEASLVLRALVPKNLPEESRPPKLAAIYQEMDKIPDEFVFIRETVVRWDYKNRQVREGHERERRSRQEESERHLDTLFNNNEIGYSDIGTLEAEFKLAEAKRKYEEDQRELESFTTQVFEPVTERLQTEISQLSTQYVLAVDLLDLKSDSASHFMNGSGDRARSSQVMDVTISLFNKLQVRYQKLAEAHFERERRRKKLELTVLYANGDVTAVKKLEQEFLRAERLQVLHEAQERDTRANKLMDMIDRATVRILGDNQTYVDDLCVKLRKMDAALARDGQELSQNNFEVGDLRETLLELKIALEFVAADSNAVLRASNTADTILNDADYAVSVAKAEIANATVATYEKLKEEKQKEDAKIREDLDARRESIAKGPADASSIVENIVARTEQDPAHQERIQRALEAAKLRNAAKDS